MHIKVDQESVIVLDNNKRDKHKVTSENYYSEYGLKYVRSLHSSKEPYRSYFFKVLDEKLFLLTAVKHNIQWQLDVVDTVENVKVWLTISNNKEIYLDEEKIDNFLHSLGLKKNKSSFLSRLIIDNEDRWLVAKLRYGF